MHPLRLAAALLLSASLPAAESATPAGSGNEVFAWSLGAHVGVPIGPAVSASAIIGHANRFGADGLLLMAEPGLGGIKFAAGYADIDGSKHGPYLLKGAHDWNMPSGFLWPSRGWSARGVVVQTFGAPLSIDSNRTFAGAEGELIGTFGTGSSWGGLHGVNLTFGLLTNIDNVDHRDAMGHGEYHPPGDEWRLVLELGIGL
jgi:hypothetical protein